MSGFTLAASTARPLRILLIEDSVADSDLLVDMLEQEMPGVIVTVTTTVSEAIPLLVGALDMAITDLSLPDAEGLQALEAIFQARPDIAVVVMTGRQDRRLALAALSAGAEDYLVKGSMSSHSVATSVLYAAHRRSVERETYRYERLALDLLDATEAPTCAVDPTGQIVAVNRAWRVFGSEIGRHSLLADTGRNYFDVCDQATGPEAAGASDVADGLRLVLTGRADRFQVDYPCHSPDQDRWFSLRINPIGATGGAVLTHVDVSAAKRAEGALSYSSLHDVLTGLPNRTLLFDRLQQALAVTVRSQRQVAVGFLDIDQFKRVNDTLGHPAGDALLLAVSDRLSACLREGDTLSRFAGDEFVVVWPMISSAEEARVLAQRLARAFEEPFLLGTSSLAVTASVGVAVGKAPQSADELLLAADAAMYDAKREGRGRTRVYTKKLKEGADARLRLEAELSEALDRRELVLHYQPVVDLQRNVVTGVEALARWPHREGMRMPDSFIPVAEASGLIVPLGSWVVEEACRQGAEWAADGIVLNIAVNLSARQVSHPDIVPTVAGALERSGFDPSRLLVEITESAVMEDAEAALLALSAIAALGCGIAIDDFGTGYSSLVYLKQYPVHALKVDRSFVAGMGVNADDDAIVASVVGLARAFGAVCIAEGVETWMQRDALYELGCQAAQGFLFARPVSAVELPRTVAACEQLLCSEDGASPRGDQGTMPRPRRGGGSLRAGSAPTTSTALGWPVERHDDNPYERLGHLALRVLNVPVASVELIKGGRSFPVVNGGSTFSEPDHLQAAARRQLVLQLHHSGGLVVVPEVMDDSRTSNNAWLLAMGIRSLAATALEGPDGEQLGCVFAADVVPRVWTADNLSALTAVADSAATQAVLSGAVRGSKAVAAMLQLSMLTKLPDVAPLQIVARYVPAPDAAQIGGDWYDAFRLPDGGLALAVGDVTGQGIPASAVMGQLRNLLRGIAWRSTDGPHRVLSMLDEASHALLGMDLATVVYACVESSSAAGLRISWANAGHPAPLRVTADGRTDYLDQPSGPPLCFGDAHHVDGVVELAPLSTLLLYTDGLVSSRAVDFDQGFGRLQLAASESAAWPLERMCDHILSSLTGSDSEDDVTLLALRVPSATAGTTSSLARHSDLMSRGPRG